MNRGSEAAGWGTLNPLLYLGCSPKAWSGTGLLFVFIGEFSEAWTN